MANILIVEDEPLIAMMLEEWIADLGHMVVGPTATVNEAVELINKDIIHAALLDVRLREHRSDEIAQILTTLEVPFAFTTGDSSDIVSGDFADRPYVTKPYGFETIQSCLESLLAPLN